MELILLAYFEGRFMKIYLFCMEEKQFASDLGIGKDSTDLRQEELNVNHRIITLTHAILNISKTIQATVCLTQGENLLSKLPGNFCLIGVVK